MSPLVSPDSADYGQNLLAVALELRWSDTAHAAQRIERHGAPHCHFHKRAIAKDHVRGYLRRARERRAELAQRGDERRLCCG